MTIQVVSAAGEVLLLLAVALCLVLLISAAVQAGRRRNRSALKLGGALIGIVGLYGVALGGVGVTSGPVQLQRGDAKCFDDWCASMLDARVAAGDGVLVDVRLENRGRGRAMRSDLARAYLEVPGRGLMGPRDGHMLQSFLTPGRHVDFELSFDVPAGTHGMRFVISEDADTVGPGTFTIGDEGSPFHAKAGWPLPGLVTVPKAI